jgi:hypothetical protein
VWTLWRPNHHSLPIVGTRGGRGVSCVFFFFVFFSLRRRLRDLCNTPSAWFFACMVTGGGTRQRLSNSPTPRQRARAMASIVLGSRASRSRRDDCLRHGLPAGSQSVPETERKPPQGGYLSPLHTCIRVSLHRPVHDYPIYLTHPMNVSLPI